MFHLLYPQDSIFFIQILQIPLLNQEKKKNVRVELDREITLDQPKISNWLSRWPEQLK